MKNVTVDMNLLKAVLLERDIKLEQLSEATAKLESALVHLICVSQIPQEIKNELKDFLIKR